MLATWIVPTAVLFAIKVTTLAPTSSGYVTLLGGGLDPLTTLLMLLSSLLLAGALFATSAVVVPLIVDRDAGPVAAVQVSWRAVTHNVGPMLRWAGVIVGLIAVGALTAFISMLVIFPLLAYASWHAYRDLIGAAR